jgi:hypothetical protein
VFITASGCIFLIWEQNPAAPKLKAADKSRVSMLPAALALELWPQLSTLGGQARRQNCRDSKQDCGFFQSWFTLTCTALAAFPEPWYIISEHTNRKQWFLPSSWPQHQNFFLGIYLPCPGSETVSTLGQETGNTCPETRSLQASSLDKINCQTPEGVVVFLVGVWCSGKPIRGKGTWLSPISMLYSANLCIFPTPSPSFF